MGFSDVSESPQTWTPPFVSVIVPTHARVDLLEKCLRTLLAQDYPPDRYEVVVVQDRPANERVNRLLTELSTMTPVRLRLEVSPGTGPSAARNLGWRTAQGSIIAFTDDDVLVSPGWLREGAKLFQDGISGVAGRTVVPLPLSPTDYQRNVGRLGYCRFITCNVFYRRESLESVGGFDERFQRAYREDTDLVFSLREKGFKLTESDSAVVHHPPRTARWMSSVFEQSKQMYDALLFKKHPRLFREFIKKRPPFQYYAITLGYLGLPVAALVGNWLVVALLATVVLGLEAEFLARRLRGTSKAFGHVLEMVISSLLIPPVAVYWRLRGAWRFKVPFL